MTKGVDQISGPHRIAVLRGTRAETDEQLLQSWLDSLNSPHARDDCQAVP
jgi:hypothetical protein